jgi:hypothetical protein
MPFGIASTGSRAVDSGFALRAGAATPARELSYRFTSQARDLAAHTQLFQ